jgi:hypothetical protein
MTNKRIVKSYQDIAVIEVIRSDGTANRAYLVRVATQRAARRLFADLDAARMYFDALVLQRLNPVTSTAFRH